MSERVLAIPPHPRRSKLLLAILPVTFGSLSLLDFCPES